MNPQWSNQHHQQQQQRLTPQQTGWQQPMMTGYGGQMQPQMTGMPPPMPQMQHPMQTGYAPMGGMQQQQLNPNARFGQPPPMPTMVQPQATGYPGQQQQQGSQMLGSFSAVPSTFLNTFMPSNPNANWSGSAANMPQQQHAPAPLPQYFQQHNQQAMGQSAVQVQWALTADERRKYDQIFRAWDNSSGYITGNRALEVFKESGLERDDLMKVWALADRENRGKLNLAEFHVAMGLIYRRLSGNPIPDVLPAELVPPSSRDLDHSVDFLKDLLRNDTNARSTNLDPTQEFPRGGSPAGTNKYAKVRSFNANASPDPASGAGRKDATSYKHNDSDVKTYKSSSRHLDRRNVRFSGEDENDELASMKRDLQSTQAMLDKAGEEEEEDMDLKAELDDLKYRIRRVKDDIEYNKSGRRTEAKDQEKRRLERDLLFLMHEKLPELEDKMKNRERTKRSEERAAARKRDARNNSSRPHGRDRQDDSDNDNDKDGDAEEKERGYLRGSFGGDSSGKKSSQKGRARFAEDSDDEPDSPAASAPSSKGRSTDSAAPPPPSAPPAAAKATNPPPAPPVPAPVAAKKPQTAEERQAFIRAEAQRRVQERMRVLTGQSPSASPPPQAVSQTTGSSVDSSVQERLEQDKREAAERAKNEDVAVQERERLRQLRLEEERLGSIKKEEKLLADQNKALQKVGNEITAAEVHNASGEREASNAAREELDSEEKTMREREEALKAEKRKREERMKQLEAELEESKRLEEEFERKKNMFAGATKSKGAPPPPPASRSGKAAPKPPPSRTAPPAASKTAPSVAPAAAPAFSPPAPAAPTPPSAPSPPPAPAAPPAPATASVTASPSPQPVKGSNNPFHRLGAGQAGAAVAVSPASSPAAAGSAPKGANNPFFRPATGAIASPPPPVVKPTPIRPKRTNTEDDWGDAANKDSDSDSSDDEGGANVKQTRANLAGMLFGGVSGSTPSNSRPGSARPESPAVGGAGGPPPPPGPPKAPAGPLPKLGAQAGSPPPRSALLGAIQGGAKLRKTATVDKSIVKGAGAVIGDASAPVQTFVPPPRSPSPPPAAPAAPAPPALQIQSPDKPSSSAVNNRQSVDWYGGLAADTYPSPTLPQGNTLAPMREESEEDSSDDEPAVEQKQNGISTEAASTEEGPEADFDFSASTRVRSLYPYEAQREQDAGFAENLLIIAHPAKDKTSDWLYGMVVATGSKGWLPKTYVEELPFNTPAKVLYDYQAQSEDELSIREGTALIIGDKVDSDWARAVLDGKVGLVPLAYLEEEGSSSARPERDTSTAGLRSSKPAAPREEARNVEATPDKAGIVETRRTSDAFTSGKNDESSDDSDDSSSDEADGADLNEDDSLAKREAERARVLAAAGLVVQQAPPPNAPRRRPPPPRPRPVSTLSNASQRNGSVTPVAMPSPALSFATADEELTPTDRLLAQYRKDYNLPDPPAEDTGTPVQPDDAYTKWEKMQREAPATAAADMPSATAHASSSPSLTGGPTGSSFAPELRPSSQVSPPPTTASTASSFISSLFSSSTNSRSASSAQSARPSIGAPQITRVGTPTPSADATASPAVPAMDGSSSLGKTWSSLVDPSALATMPEPERKRQEAIFELIKSESTYLTALQRIVQEFFARLQPLLDDVASQVIFANIEDILMWSVTFLSDLEDRQRQCRLYIDRVGDIVFKHAPGLSIYKPYCLNQTNASRMLASLRNQDPAVKDVLNTRVNGLGLEHFLLEPMQRLARYPLLLQQILKYTSADDADFADLRGALQLSQGVLNETNEGLRAQEDEEKLGFLSDNLIFPDDQSIRLDLTAPTRLLGPRHLLKEGMLVKGYGHKRQSKRKELQTYLFNDFVLFTTASVGHGLKDRLAVAGQQRDASQHPDSIMVYRTPMPLEELSVRPAPREENVLIISHRGEDYKLQTGSAKQKLDWVQQIEKARQAVLQVKEQGRR